LCCAPRQPAPVIQALEHNTSPWRTDMENEAKVEMNFEHSAELDKLFEALAKAQAAFSPIKKDRTNPFFKSKYADLQAVIEATKKPLSENGLAFIQITYVNGGVKVISILGHSSGQWIRGTLSMPVSKMDAQGIGSAITYGRRYSQQAIIGVSAEEDDDGNAAVSGPKKPETSAIPKKGELLNAIYEAPNADALQKAFARAYRMAKEANDVEAEQTFVDAKDQRKEELSNARN
jgi:hypothetical protein